MPLKKPSFYKSLCYVALSTALCSPLTATAHEEISGWNWSGEFGNLHIDPKVAYDQYIDRSATIVGFAGERYTDSSDFTLTLGLDFIAYGDNDPFTNYTTQGQKSSSASAMLAFAEYGPKVRFGFEDMNYFIAHGGVSHVFASSRSIAYCSDCESHSIDVNGGLYGILGVGHSFNSFDLDVQFQQYFTGDLDNSLRLKVSFSF